MQKIMMTSAIVLAAAAFSLPVNAQNNTGANTQEQVQMNQTQQGCAKNWPVVDKNDDTKISEEEAKQATELDFDRLDADGNGIVSAMEWAECASPQAQEGDVWSAEADIFEKMDSDKSGDVSAQEAAKETEQRFSNAGDGAKQKAMFSGARFAAIDANSDGMIDNSEWTNRENATIEKRFQALDTNGDGELTKSEFTSYRDQRFSEAQQANQQDEPTVWVYYYYVL